MASALLNKEEQNNHMETALKKLVEIEEMMSETAEIIEVINDIITPFVYTASYYSFAILHKLPSRSTSCSGLDF